MGAVQINKDYRIDVDGNCFTLQHRTMWKDKKNKTNEEKEVWSNLSWHTSWPSVINTCIKLCVNQKVNEKDIVPFKEFIELYKETRAEFRELLKSLDGK